MLVGM